jgi:hypothetical protein
MAWLIGVVIVVGIAVIYLVEKEVDEVKIREKIEQYLKDME